MQNHEHQNGIAGDVTHPAREEWMGWLYGELPRTDRDRLRGHLNQCPTCQARVGQWRSAMGALEEWKLQPARPAATPHLLKWAVAAALVLGLGLGLGAGYYMAASTRDVASLRRELQTSFQVRLDRQRGEILAEVLKAVDDRRAVDSAAVFTTLREMNAAHRADYDALDNKLQTVAVLTERGLSQEQQQIVNLVSSGPN